MRFVAGGQHGKIVAGIEIRNSLNHLERDPGFGGSDIPRSARAVAA